MDKAREGGGAAAPVTVIRCGGGERAAAADVVAVEEPLEIRVGGERLVVLMRTPGHDIELAAGFLLTEGLVESPAQIGAIGFCPDEPEPDLRNVVVVHPASGCVITPPERRFYAASACGVCGKTSIRAVSLAVRPLAGALTVAGRVLTSLPPALRAVQEGFQATGGLHAAGLFDAEGRLACAREDVGRHNAVDKVVGAMALKGHFPLPDRVLLLSGRASFEVCQKAAMAGIPVVASISAPSSLAVALSADLGLTLVGFLRGDTCNIYAGADRVL
ncbi:MAG: formate dehydrogenase accessory sulfurtransferase FdhD [Armatimonadetes bacterium]|nr:formate dehydrogenase accessory sulfurtransferase FdhD [Armatimonadota bacterium]